MFKKVKALTVEVEGLSEKIEAADLLLLKEESELQETDRKINAANVQANQLKAVLGSAQVFTSLLWE